jgi:hypothetical protein
MRRDVSSACTSVGLVAMVAAVLLAAPLLLPAQTVDVLRTDQGFELPYTATLTPDDLAFGHALGYDTVSLPGEDFLMEPGQPLVPVQIVRIALPAGMAVTSVRLVSTETLELPGEYLLLPVQPPQPLNRPMVVADFVPPDPATYSSSTPYPAETVSFMQETDLAGQAIAVVRICPVHYAPADRKLSLCTTTKIALEGVSGYTCGDYLPQRISANAGEYYEHALAGMVVNPDDVEVRTASNSDGSRTVPPGDYDYVIITTSDWVSAFQPLADWKTQKGVPANIVTTMWIYANYSGTNAAKVRAFVQDAYTNWGTTFFLLGGDTAYVPYYARTFSGVDPDPVPNDTYYADFDSDWLCEVHVGRASVNSTGTGAGGIAAFISKVLNYEKFPPATDYARKAGFFGFDLDSSTHAEQCKLNIRSSFVPTTWTVATVYDSQGGNHRNNVIAAMNAGQMLLNHADHSSSDYMGTGYINHDLGIDNSDMDALTNGNRQSILYSMGCDPAAYDANVCIAEHFVRNTNGGGIAFIGNSRYGWYNTGSYNTYSMRYDQYFFRSLLPQNNYRLGTAFSDHKNDGYPTDEYYQYIWTELTLLGDPEIPVWTDTWQPLTATYPASVDVGVPNTFTVQVSSGSGPVAAATVCLWKAGDVYLILPTDSSGSATFVFTPTSTGTVSVTATKRNYVPYEGTASVIQQSNYTLTVNINGQGTVTLDPPGGTYAPGTSVQLTAGPALEWQFDRWSGDLSGSANPATIVMARNASVTAMFGRLGDLNCDGVVDNFDITPLVLALTATAPNYPEYYAVYPNCSHMNGDINRDGIVDNFDISPFVALLTGR